MDKTEVSIRASRNGMIVTIKNNTNQNYSDGEWNAKTVQEAMIMQYEALFPNSDSATLRFLREQG